MVENKATNHLWSSILLFKNTAAVRFEKTTLRTKSRINE